MDFVAWCGNTLRYEDYPRVRLNMEPEPYGKAWGTPGNDLDVPALHRQVEETLGSAWESWQWLYQRLGDIWSRELLITLLAYRSIGWRYVSLPLNNGIFWAQLKKLSLEELELHKKGFSGFKDGPQSLSKFDLSKYGFEGFVYTDAFGLFSKFLYPQYIYRGEDFLLEPSPGSYVIDCGACFGATSVHFAQRVGPQGRVLSFECLPDNLDIYRKNVSLTPTVLDRIQLVESPVWSEKGLEMEITGKGPGAQVHILAKGQKSADGGSVVRSTSIDTEVDRLQFPRVDLIKMAIEGSEYEAMKGARRTLERFKPALAISVYHKLCDFYDIPQLVDGWGLEYDFYLQHSTPHGDETVIFGTPKRPN